MGTQEKFDYEKVKSKLDALDGVFNKFLGLLENVNTKITENIGVGEESALHGIVAEELLDSWNCCSSKFVIFEDEFDQFIELVSKVSSNNENLEAAVIDFYSKLN